VRVTGARVRDEETGRSVDVSAETVVVCAGPWTRALVPRVPTTPTLEHAAYVRAGAGLPIFNPHSFRKTLAQLGQKKCRTIEEMKAWSQNLGHEELMTTFASYGTLSRNQQADIMGAFAR